MSRRWILWLILIAFIWLVISQFAEIEKLAATQRTGAAGSDVEHAAGVMD